MTSGYATVDATKAYADRTWAASPSISPNSWRVAEGLTIGKIGLGSYRMDETHSDAIKTALLSGVNLIDTASNYTNGQSETSIGGVLANLFDTGTLKREELVIVTKGGFVRGPLLESIKQTPPPDMLFPQPHLGHGLHPALLEQQLTTSRKRLGVETVDFYLLHNPEVQLAHINKEELYEQIKQAFTFLETQAQQGHICYYGVTSNNFGLPQNHPHHINLAEVFVCAQQAAQAAWGRRKRPLFRAIQAPFNLLEQDLAENINTTAKIFDGEENVTTLELATRMHLTVLANRPLNAELPNGLMLRLANSLRTPELMDEKLELRQQAVGALLEQLTPNLPQNWQDVPLQQIALNAVASTPGISCTLTGLRHPSYVEDVTTIYQKGDFADPAPILGRAA